MLKITAVIQTPELIRLKLEGKLAAPRLEPFLETCRSSIEASQQVELDLLHVSFVDTPGLLALREAISSGIRISARSPFVAAMLRTAGLE